MFDFVHSLSFTIQARPPKTPSKHERLKHKLFGRKSLGDTPSPQENKANGRDNSGDEEDVMSIIQPQQYTISKMSRPAGVSSRLISLNQVDIIGDTIS